MQNSQLKIVYNDDCVDLRGGLNPTKRMMLELEPRSAQEARNEIVNSALKKLAKTYHSNTQTNPRWKPRNFRWAGWDQVQVGAADRNEKAPEVQEPIVQQSSDSTVIPFGLRLSDKLYTVFCSSGRGDVASQLAPSKNTFTMAKPTRADNQERSKGKTLIKDKSLE
uniref:Uncharacterized protein n=1 Tax=Dendroctonus ponderosae TaxID=77166 RepID=A0AAR5QFT6_DENPD